MKNKYLFMGMKLYKKYQDEFTDYIDGLANHNVKLSDLRLKQICRKWEIDISDDNKGGYWVSAEWNEHLQSYIHKLLSLKK